MIASTHPGRAGSIIDLGVTQQGKVDSVVNGGVLVPSVADNHRPLLSSRQMLPHGTVGHVV